jgi:hypothetical protein
MRKLNTRDQVIENFSDRTETLFKDTMTYYVKRSADLILEGSGWGEQV